MELSLVMPAYNEEKRIPTTLHTYLGYLKARLKNDFEIIVVSNNCTDNTLKVVEDFAGKMNKDSELVRILNFPDYIGKGQAVMEGFNIAYGKYVGFADADNSITPENFFKLYKNRENYDCIIASRRKKSARIIPKRSWNKNLSSYLFNKAVNLLFNFKIKDTQCGAKLFAKDAVNCLLKNYSETGWIFDVDLIYLCKKNNLSILEQPIIWSDSPGSKLKFASEIKAVFQLINYRIKTL